MKIAIVCVLLVSSCASSPPAPSPPRAVLELGHRVEVTRAEMLERYTCTAGAELRCDTALAGAGRFSTRDCWCVARGP